MIVIPGNYPRSENLIQTTRDFERQRINHIQLNTELEKEFNNFLELQNKIKSPFISTGLFNYQDLLRPLTIIFQNSQANTLLRFEDTNMFWRKLEINSKINYENLEKYFNQYLKIQNMKNYDYIVSLPSVITLSKYSNLKPEQASEIIIEISQIIQEKWQNISSKKLALCFIEYTHIQNLKTIIKFSEKLSLLIKNYKFIFFKNKIDDIQNLNKLQLDGISINFYKNHIKNFEKLNLNFKYLFAGVINTNTTLIEDQLKIIEFINHLKNIYKAQIYITDDFCAELLPQNIMNKKLETLSNSFMNINYS